MIRMIAYKYLASQRDFQFLDFKERKGLIKLKDARSLKRTLYYFLAHKFRGNVKNCIT